MAALGSWMRWYKKPSYVDLKSFVTNLNKEVEEQPETDGPPVPSKVYRLSQTNAAIPKNLALERILADKTCSPLSLYDFYMYLKHVEFSQENLEFYMWFKDYEKRYANTAKKAANNETSPLLVKASGPGYTIMQTTTVELDEKASDKTRSFDESAYSEFITYVESLVLYRAAAYPKPCCSAVTDAATCKIPALSQQQHAEELEYVAELFLRPGSLKELNIPPSLRKATVDHLASSDSTEYLSKVADHIYLMLKHCSHQNFVRLGVNNGTMETLCMVTIVGMLFSGLGFLLMFLLAFASPGIHESSRWRGLACIPFWFIGISFLLAGLRGSCFLLLLFSHRQELPWERIQDESSTRTKDSKNPVVKFAKKLMIFEKKIRVKDVGLRRLQRKIVIQSVVGAVVGTAILEVFFLCLPIWR